MSNELEKKAYYGNIYECYKSLLTDKQINTFESYYYEDFSLAEIAEAFNVSRNAIWDSLKNTIAILENYESKLHLYENMINKNKLYDELKLHTDEEGKKIIEKLIDME